MCYVISELFYNCVHCKFIYCVIKKINQTVFLFLKVVIMNLYSFGLFCCKKFPRMKRIKLVL